ncbi:MULTISPECIES: phosphoglycerate kinase [Limosilactobacillus]|jgi:phosphoglycerate kinase|uniref:Phosphoglycerate kinase n=2 Tax=Limosilactobacillus vaginalis TaxID=1633 RepID=A0AAW5WU83_9LACO|nr:MULTISPECIES: phosphoglycerate kinase [Limosilactobacillus]MCR5524921.1 phosphoglycerate kinase [Lactobacillus sp.]PEH03946.1 phosphoglycerate kinase [Lactobacillus sp. UMNPBX5]EEJ40819.1 phosphoglycerate kinase [Limosilactobacillus vaginalis DSM 5837 = ATCC 49540]KRM48579.1 phosphoglycerate kinase [Limosilactobacillus vaginalis DSM 5837 = ATCC 49540]MCZ2465218.1 phosphoglycerate kinase [Limosilactobacillus vaginalis]
MAKLTVEDLPLSGKKVLMRVDFNVPISDDGTKVEDDNRIVAALPTIKYVIEHGGKAILFSHLGRIKKEEDKPAKSLKAVAERLSELLDKPVKFVPVTEGKELEDAINELKDGEVLLVQNTRYEDVKDGEYVKRESGNDPELGKYWASLGDVYVNDAFGTAHRKHASNVGIATNMPGKAAAGFLMEKEIKFLGDAVDNPQRPFVAILGGAKVSDKIGVIDNLLDKADKIIIGGGMAYTFYAAKGIKTGDSLVEKDKIDVAKKILDKAGDKIVLPIDNVVADKFDNDANTKVVEGDIDDGWMALDIGPKSVEEFKNVLKDAKTVVWNGPMGVFEKPNFAKGTLEVGKFLGTLNDATTIVGGGDSTAAVKQLGVADQLTHISTGGGASLTYLEGKTLPGIAAISEK